MTVLLLSTYELGRQPFGLASPAAWLRSAGHDVFCQDLSQERLNPERVREAELVCFYLPMHTATRIALRAIERVRALSPDAHLCCYGLYAPVNAELLRSHGVETILGGEFEAELLRVAGAIAETTRDITFDVEAHNGGSRSIPKLSFIPPDRTTLPPLQKYARLKLPDGEQRVVGYTEASRGCRHLCRHCPVVPVYNGTFRVVQREVVLQDIRQQVAMGAEHITFGDPDFFNGPGHAVAIVEAMHQEFPALSYDVTIKIEHLLKFAEHLATLRSTGCALITTAVESMNDRVLALLEKGHSRADFVRAVELMRGIGLPLAPSFIPFTPWTTLTGYADLLRVIAELDLVENVSPVQLAIRLLIPAGSRLLELAEVRDLIGEFDADLLSYRWANRDPRVDELQKVIETTVAQAAREELSRSETFARIWRLADVVPAAIGRNGRAQLGSAACQGEDSAVVFTHAADSLPNETASAPVLAARATIPYLTEPWYC